MEFKMARPERRLIIIGIIGLIGLLLFIAGAIMLGVGIHKSNQKTERTISSKPAPKYLTMKAPTNFSNTQLQNSDNYQALINNITTQLQNVVINSPMINIISINPAPPNTYRRDVFVVNAINYVDILAALIYSSEADENVNDIRIKIQNSTNTTGFQLIQIYNDTSISSSTINNTLCQNINPGSTETGSTTQGPPGTLATTPTQSTCTCPTTTGTGTTSTSTLGTGTSTTGTGTTQSTTTGIGTSQPTTTGTGTTQSTTTGTGTTPVQTTGTGTTTTETTQSTTTTAPVPYSPCPMFINTIVDASNGLTSTQFSTQLSFLAFDIFGVDWTHFERLNYGSYANRLQYYGFIDGIDKLTVQQEVLHTLQENTTAPNIRNTLQALDNIPVNTTYQLSTIVFLSAVNEANINASVTFAQSLQNKGRLTIVALGPASSTPNQQIIQRLTPNIIPWDLTQGTPSNYQALFWAAYGCNGTAPTDTPPTPGSTFGPTTSLGSTAPPPIPYQPCQNWIIIIFDSSNSLNVAQFTAEKSFLANSIFNSVTWNHYERLAIFSFADRPDTGLPFGSKTLDEIHSYILSATQPTTCKSCTASISEALLYANTVALSNATGVYTILLTASANPNDVASAVGYAQNLNRYGGFSVLTLGTNDFSAISQLSTNVLNWANPSPQSPTPDNYQTWFNVSYGCGGPIVAPTSQASTTATPPPSTPYCLCTDCNRYVTVIIDISGAMTSTVFYNQKYFIETYLLAPSSFNHYERLNIIYYQRHAEYIQFNASNTYGDVQAFIDRTIQQTTEVFPSVNQALGTATSLRTNVSVPMVTILFTSTAGADDIELANSSAQVLRAAGRFTVVTLGDNVFNAITNTNFADYIISWPSDTLPPDWNNNFAIAYMCNSIPATTVATQPPSTAPITTQPTTTPGTTGTTPPAPYTPCPMFINTIVDASNGLTSSQFATQLSFLAFDIFGVDWTHFERLNYGSYANRLQYYGFIDGIDKLTVQQEVLHTLQENTTAPNIRNTLQALDNIPVNTTYQLSTIVFLSAVNETNINESVAFAQSLQNKGRLTIVALGPASSTPNQQIIQRLTPNIIPWDLTQGTPSNYQALFWAAYGCNGTAPTDTPPSQPTTQAATTQTSISGQTTPNPTTQSTTLQQVTNPTTVISTETVSSSQTSTSVGTTNVVTTSTLTTIGTSTSLGTNVSIGTTNTITSSTPTPTGTTVASAPYCLCSDCSRYVIILIDVSNAMSFDQFNNQKTFLTNYLLGTGNFNHFERVAVIFYSDVVIGNASFGSFQSHDDLFNYINNINQTAVTTPKIAPALSLAASPSVLINTTSTVTILFTATADPTDVSTATTSANTLRAAGRLSAVTIGDANFGPINNNFADYVIPWASGSTPPNGNGNDWENYFKIALMCSVLPATTPTPIVTTQFVTTTMISAPTTTTNPAIYIPCQKFFVLLIDISIGLTATQYAQEIDFITTNLIADNWTHIENVGVEFYSDHADIRNFNASRTVDGLRQIIRGNNQTTATPTLYRALVAADEIYQNNPYSISYILFTSTTDGISRSGTVAAAQSLANKGKFTVVTLGTADFTLVNNITNNIIQWPDMSQPPVDWQSLIYNALDCNGSSTIAPPTSITPITQTTPSTLATSPPTSTATSSSTSNAQIISTTQPTTQPVATTQPATGPSSSNVCNSYIALAVDDSASITDAVFNLQVNYINDTTNGFFSLYNRSIPTFSWYAEGGATSFDSYNGGFSLLQTYINTVLKRTTSSINWSKITVYSGLTQMANDADDANIYPLQIPLNTIIFINSAPPPTDEVKSLIQRLATPTFQYQPRSVIGVLLNNVNIDPGLSGSGLKTVIWTDDHASLTSQLRHIDMTCA